MITAALVELRIYLRNPQLVVLLVVIPLTLVAVLSSALDPVFPGDNAYQSTVPGFAVMFGFYGMAFAADCFFRERLWGNACRLSSLPIEAWRLTTGKLMAPVAVVALQLALLLMVGRVAFGVHLGSPPALAAVILATALAGCAPGLLLAGVARSRIGLDQLANLVVIGMGSLGGAVVPVERLPEPLARLAPITPQYWALEGFERVTVDGVGIPGVIVPVTILVAVAVVLHAVGARAYRVDRMVEAA